MKRTSFLAMLLIACAHAPASTVRSTLQRELESYVIARCLSTRADPLLQDQARGWLSMVVFRANFDDFAVWEALDAQVKPAAERGKEPLIHDEDKPGGENTLPVAFCADLIDEPPIRAAIDRSLRALRPTYERVQERARADDPLWEQRLRAPGSASP